MKKFSKYIIELIVLVVGITLSFMVDEWREDREKSAQLEQIFSEIKTNVEFDLKELQNDTSFINYQLICLEKLINLNDTLQQGELAHLITVVLFVRWPDFKSVGINQLKNSIAHVPKNDKRVSTINDYYSRFQYMQEVQPYAWVKHAEGLQAFFIENNLSPTGWGMTRTYNLTENEINAYFELLLKPNAVTKLKYLKASRQHQLNIWNIQIESAEQLLTLL